MTFDPKSRKASRMSLQQAVTILGCLFVKPLSNSSCKRRFEVKFKPRSEILSNFKCEEILRLRNFWFTKKEWPYTIQGHFWQANYYIGQMRNLRFCAILFTSLRVIKKTPKQVLSWYTSDSATDIKYKIWRVLPLGCVQIKPTGSPGSMALVWNMWCLGLHGLKKKLKRKWTKNWQKVDEPWRLLASPVRHKSWWFHWLFLLSSSLVSLDILWLWLTLLLHKFWKITITVVMIFLNMVVDEVVLLMGTFLVKKRKVITYVNISVRISDFGMSVAHVCYCWPWTLSISRNLLTIPAGIVKKSRETDKVSCQQ